jgi:hypothetical protein
MKYIFSILKFFVKTATSLGNMKKNDSNFRSHSVHRYIINKPCTFVFINIQVQISEAFLVKLSNYDSTRNTFKLATMLPFALHNLTLIDFNLTLHESYQFLLGNFICFVVTTNNVTRIVNRLYGSLYPSHATDAIE